MSRLFITVLNMSITASYVAIAIIIIRSFLIKLPKVFSYALWFPLLIRLVFPFSFNSSFSFLSFLSLKTQSSPGVVEYVPRRIGLMQKPSIDIGISRINDAINSSLPPATSIASSNPMQILTGIAGYIWIFGIVVLLIYSIISYLKVINNIKTATLVKDNIFETDKITTPFVCGFINPKIYIPTGIIEKELNFILAHEQTHIRRLDYIIKPFAFLVLIIHWFNPLMWLCYFLMSKDMEMSCDESVIRQSSEDIRASYSHSLLSLSAKQSGILIPLAFGESNIKSRIKNVLNYKKPVLWAVCPAAVLVIAISIALIANPSNKTEYLTSAEKFLKYKTDYVGDASKVGNIIQLLEFPEKVDYDYFELHTENVPYGITVHLNTDTQTRNRYTGALNQTPFEKNAVIIFSLIGNVDYINFNLTDGKNEYLIQYTKDQADAMIGKDVRELSADKNTFAQLLKIADKIEGDFIKKNGNSSISTIGGADGPLKMHETYKADESDPITGLAWEVINRDIAYYEENPEVKIIDSKITRLELVKSFDDLTDETIEVYALEYRLLPEDLSKVVLAGGMDVDEDGWLKETSSMGSPLLVVSRKNGNVKLVGILMTGSVGEESRLETSVKALLENNQ